MVRGEAGVSAPTIERHSRRDINVRDPAYMAGSVVTGNPLRIHDPHFCKRDQLRTNAIPLAIPRVFLPSEYSGRARNGL
jgi:hypothetical protein